MRVEDTGQGMTHEQIEKLFNVEFTRFNTAYNRSIEGSGLGMSITHSLITMMEGSIKVESKPEKGSIFHVRIPQVQKNDQVLGREVVENLQNLESTQMYLKRMTLQNWKPMPYGRILVVDDVESNLYVVKGLLLPYKLTVETVESGAEAVSLIREGQIYDIIFMDHMMPDMDGVEATKIIRDIGYEHPIVALTANATTGATKMFMDNGFSGFISKPIDPNKLNVYLMQFIHDKQPKEVLETARIRYPRREEPKKPTKRLTKSFLIDADKYLDTLEPLMLQQELDQASLKIYTIQTHGIKSALSNIGYPELSKTAAILEKAGRNKNIKQIQEQTPPFLTAIKALVGELKKPEEEPDKPGQDYNPAFIKEQFSAISKACETYDKKTLKNILDELKQKGLSEKLKIVVEEIDSCLLVSEFEKVSQISKKVVEDFL